MHTMKIAVIAYFFPESSLPLAKYMADTDNEVDYYFVTDQKARNTSAFDFWKAGTKVGITKLNAGTVPQIYAFWPEIKASLHLVRFYWLPFKFLPVVKEGIACLSLRKAIKQLNDRKYDVINLIGHDTLLKYLDIKLTCKVKVHSLHEVAPHYPGMRLSNRLLTYLFKHKRPIIVHSEASLNTINGYEDASVGQHIYQIPFGLFETFRAIPASENVSQCDFLLYYGRILPYKGLDVLNEALTLLKEKLPGLKTVVAGAGKDASLTALKANPDCLVINRYLSNEDIVELNSKAKAVVCPYRSASQSGIVVTAFAFGKPIIATSVGAFKETVVHGENGMLVAPNSPGELADVIYRVFTDNQLYSQLTRGADKFCALHPQYDWNNIARSTLRVFERHVYSTII